VPQHVVEQYDTKRPATNEMTYGQNPVAPSSSLVFPTAASHALPSTVNQIAPQTNSTIAPTTIPR
jgi:hypothetical protein